MNQHPCHLSHAAHFCSGHDSDNQARVAELIGLAKQYKDERDTAIRERDVAVRQRDGLRRDIAKLLAEHGGMP